MTPHALAAGFIALIPLRLPPLPYGVQAADAALLALLAALAPGVSRPRWRAPDVMLTGCLAASALSWALSPGAAGGLALAKETYVALIYACFAALAAQGEAPRLARWMAAAAAATAALGLLAAARFALTGEPTPALGQVMSLPYVGRVFRLTALFETPEMLVDFLAFALPLVLGLSLHTPAREARGWKAGAAALAAAAFLTFGRGLPGAAVGALYFLWPALGEGWRRWLRGALALGAAGGVVGVNLALGAAVRRVEVSRDRDRGIAAPEYPYALQQAEAGAPRLTLAVTYNPMSYWLLKRTALEAFTESPLAGIGLGRFPEAAERAYRAGRLHERYRAARPHSTWLGRLAETGLIGGLALAAFWAALLGLGSGRTPPADGWTARALIAGALGLLVNSVNADVMHFRFLWVGFGLLRGLRREDGGGTEFGRGGVADQGP